MSPFLIQLSYEYYRLLKILTFEDDKYENMAEVL